MDGQIDSVDAIVSAIGRVKPSIVGISMYSTSIKNTVRITQEAKASGAITILGNDHASFHHRTLLSKVPEVDYICVGDVGEDTLGNLVDYALFGGDLSIVPNIAYRRRGEIIVQRDIPGTSLVSLGRQVKRSSTLDRISIPDRTLLAPEYWLNYKHAFVSQHHRTIDSSQVRGVATINRARGCARARNRCRYCGIADLDPKASSASMFWKDVKQAGVDVNANFLYEAFDSATSWPSLIESWADAKPKGMEDVRFKMYAQAAETNTRTVQAFKKLGVYCVNTGFDSGDDYALSLLKGRDDSVATNKRAALLWSEAEIEIYTSFVLVGLGDEAKTRKSLDATLRFAEWLATQTTTISFDAALMYPDISSRVGRWIWHPEDYMVEAKELGWDFLNFDQLLKVSNRWRDALYIDPLQLCEDFAAVCGVKAEVLMEYENQLQLITQQKAINFGRSQGGPAE
jgi:anaerobic magnesium-protoporphyrin IX monomethyl ester cyclase